MSGSKRKRVKDIIVNVNVPQSVGQQARGGQYGAAAAGFLFANPVLAIIIAVVGIALFVILGGVALGTFFELMLNPWTWVLALLVGMVAKPGSGTVIGFAIIVGLLFWGIGIYQEYMAWQQICNIPIIGWIACGAWNIITFLPKLFFLGLHVMTAFVQIWIISFLKYELSK